MASDSQNEIYRALVSARDKYTYFLLGAVGAAIAFALSQTQHAKLSLSEVPLGLAVLSWGLSFIFGCLHLLRTEAILFENYQFIRMQRNELPEFPPHPELISAIRGDIEERSKQGGRLSLWQYVFLVSGAVLYIIWHVLEMYIRTVS